ncbi:hypothetical protein AB6A40_009747 [Gnathostoma spinigerum]|uniref:Transthyretin-like family protein n=1 Tax=Gnathostoma spinigerum TaxID=75299 RepID=A0ABD6F0H7_9BILA
MFQTTSHKCHPKMLAVAVLLVCPLLCFSRPSQQLPPRLQGVAVKGHLKCGKMNLIGAKVKLVDLDDRPDMDDLLAETYTDNEGKFQLNGATREADEIRTIIKVYHDCNDGNRPCQRKTVWHVPNLYHHSGKVHEWFDVGTVNMEVILGNEERDCRH